MDFFTLVRGLSHALSTLSLDDSSVSVLAMLGGIIGGWTITSFFLPKAKKIKVERKDDSKPRRPE